MREEQSRRTGTDTERPNTELPYTERTVSLPFLIYISKDILSISAGITLLLESREETLKIRIHLISDRADSITMLWQIYDGYKRGEPDVSRLHIPLLAQLDLGGEETKKYYPACLKRSGKGIDAAVRPPESFYSSDIRMPLVICNQREELGLSLEFQSLSDLSDEGAVQNVSGLLAVYIDGEEHLKDGRRRLNDAGKIGLVIMISANMGGRT